MVLISGVSCSRETGRTEQFQEVRPSNSLAPVSLPTPSPDTGEEVRGGGGEERLQGGRRRKAITFVYVL